jgi:hypothetical protein
MHFRPMLQLVAVSGPLVTLYYCSRRFEYLLTEKRLAFLAPRQRPSGPSPNFINQRIGPSLPRIVALAGTEAQALS